jgi:hypothetical protein
MSFLVITQQINLRVQNVGRKQDQEAVNGKRFGVITQTNNPRQPKGNKVEIASLLILLANIAMLGLNLKLYTEYFKDRKIERRRVMYPETVCNYCGVSTKNQPPGDGCHACQKGIMVKK